MCYISSASGFRKRVNTALCIELWKCAQLESVQNVIFFSPLTVAINFLIFFPLLKSQRSAIMSTKNIFGVVSFQHYRSLPNLCYPPFMHRRTLEIWKCLNTSHHVISKEAKTWNRQVRDVQNVYCWWASRNRDGKHGSNSHGIIMASRTGSLGATSTCKRSPSALSSVCRNRGMMRDRCHTGKQHPTLPPETSDRPKQHTIYIRVTFRSQHACSQRNYFPERS